jgi:hypothetical protein
MEGRIAGVRRFVMEKKLDKIREQVARLYCASGCSCCQDTEKWNAASERLAKLLDVPPYKDGSGHEWYAVRDSYDAQRTDK